MAMASCLIGTPRAQNDSPPRRNAKYHPSIWGERFTEYVSDEATLREWREKAETLKREILEMLSGNKEQPAAKRCRANLDLIDAIQRLGVGYHFEEQIEKELDQIFTSYHDDGVGDNNRDLYTVALRFRLLREHGYSVTSGIFKEFMDENGNFKNSLCDDVDGLLNLYEAAHLRVEGEGILDVALNFTTSSLQTMLPHLSPLLANQVNRALYRPLRRTLPRVEARTYISIYEQKEHHCEILLHFAKLDFNILQKLHQKELSIISKWWKNLDTPTNFPFARDRHVECYFWILGIYLEPQYSMARIFLSKVIAMASIADDIYDAYGTEEELVLLTKAVDRWDTSAIVDLPEYMKIFYQALLDVYRTAEEEMIEEGRPLHGLQYAIEWMKRLSSCFGEERKWLDKQNLPTFEEYLEVALESTGYWMLSVASLVWMGDVAKEEAFDWLINRPKIMEAAMIIARLLNDIVSHKFEQVRGHPPSGIECYTKQYSVSEEEACDVFRIRVEKAWKDINETFLRPTKVAMPVLMRLLNISRVMDILEKESDGYTHVTAEIKEIITLLLCDAFEV